MAYNLFIAYDLMKPGQNYARVIETIQSLGKWHQFQLSLFYLNTQYTPDEVFAAVMGAADSTDKVAVINAHSGIVTNWDNPPIAEINAIWTTG